MMVSNDMDRSIREATEHLLAVNYEQHQGIINRPGLKDQVAEFILSVRSALYPMVFNTELSNPRFLRATINSYLQQSAILLNELLCCVLAEPKGEVRGADDRARPGAAVDDAYAADARAGDGSMRERERIEERADRITCAFIEGIPAISDILETDIQAAYEGDPAARSTEEIMLAYPAFEAISVFRLAHCLHELGVPLLPRMMTEYAHTVTGIDIHPGARIGRWFFIDHGTGVVIGETTTIGEHVKLYQGVTLGAKSFELDENGNPVKGIKRHPDIGDRVVIYSGATILGGNTVVGDDCVIGGNVWLTHSVSAGQTLYYEGGARQRDGLTTS